MSLQVLVATEKKPSAASGVTANVIGLISVWATDSSNNIVKLYSGKTFSLDVDVSGASSVAPQSFPSAGTSSSALSMKAQALKSDVATRSSGNYLFCAKASQSACAESDWSVKACVSPSCTIQNNTLKIASASDFGTYALCDPACSAPSSGGVGGGSSPASSSLPGGAIAAIVIVPVISIILIGAALMIRKGMIFQNVAAFQFIRPTGSNRPNPNPYPSTYVDSGPRNPALAGATELSVVDSNPYANRTETNQPFTAPAAAQQVSVASLAAVVPQAPPVRSSSRSRSRSVQQREASAHGEQSSPQNRGRD
jgi:hypothetical protein